MDDYNKIFFTTGDYLSDASTSKFSWFFHRKVLNFKVILAFCWKHVFAIEITLQETLFRTGDFKRNIVSIEQKTCWQR